MQYVVADNDTASMLLCCFARYMPFDDTHGRATKWRTDFPPAEWDSISKEAKNLIESLLCVDPDKRPTSEDVSIV